MSDRVLRVRLLAEINSYQDGLRKAAASTTDFGRNVSGMGKATKADIDKVGHSALLMAGGLAVGLGLSAKAAIDWETAWTGVTKTVDGTTAQMADLEDGLRDLAKELPATHAEIAGVAEAAGALGIQRSAIEGFTKTMIDLGETTDVSADQAATALAQIANIMGTSQDDFDRLGSTLVDLGNKGASTESEILTLASRLAAAGKIAGLSEAEVFGFASTLASVGVEAEAGGTALSKVFMTVRDAVIDGGDKLQVFADTAGTTADQFVAAFKDDPSGAIGSFISGLGRMNDAGLSTSQVFKDLDLNDQRLIRALLSTAGAGELLTDQLNIGRKAWDDNIALTTEAEKRYDTTAAKLEIARNNAVDLGIDIGSVLLPALAGAAEGASSMIQGFSEMPGALQGVTLGIAGVSTAGLGMIAGAALLVPRIQALRASLLAMGSAGKVAAASMPWLAAAAAAVAGVSYVFGQNAQKAADAEAEVKGYTDAIREAGDATEGASQQIQQLLQDTPVLAEVLDQAGVSAGEMAAAMFGSNDDWDAMSLKLRDAAEAAGYTGIGLDAVTAALDAQRSRAQEGATNAETLGRVLGDTGDEAKGAAPKLGEMADSLGMNADQAESARKEFDALIDSYRAAVDPLFGMLNALDKNREAQGAEAAARLEGLAGVVDATKGLADAEKDLQKARDDAAASTGKGIADAERQLARARKGTDANAIADAERNLAEARKGSGADAIVSAEGRVADARERVTKAQADAVISDEELAQMNRDVAESALDVEVASRNLAAAVQDGTVSVDDARSMLDEWVQQGLITADQAANVAEQFGIAAGKADEFSGDYVATAYANTTAATDALDALIDKMRIVSGGTQMVIVGGSSLAAQMKAMGGPVYRASGGFSPRGTDTVPAMLTPGEFVLRKSAVDELGVANLAALNSGVMPGAMFHGGAQGGLTGARAAGAMSASYDYSRTQTWAPRFELVTADPREAAASVMFKLRHMAVGMAG